jgi:hypothetical protein
MTPHPRRRDQRPAVGPSVRRFRPSVERLEDRTVATVTYHGGALLTNVGVEALFLGSGWQDDPSLSALSGQLAGFLGSITNSGYLDQLTRAGYRVGRGVYIDGSTDPLPLAGVVSDDQIQAEIATSIQAGSLHAPDGNRLYVVFVQPGVAVTGPFGDSRFGLLGYHSDFQGPTGTGVSYAVLPFPSGANGGIPGLSPFEALTAVTSHELAESVTDPQGVNVGRPAWFDATWRDPVTGERGAEIADMTEGVFFDLNGYVVQGVVNRHRGLLAPAGGTLDPRSTGLPRQAHASHRRHGMHRAAEELSNPLASEGRGLDPLAPGVTSFVL